MASSIIQPGKADPLDCSLLVPFTVSGALDCASVTAAGLEKSNANGARKADRLDMSGREKLLKRPDQGTDLQSTAIGCMPSVASTVE